jgi:uncharacterized protein YbbK (DUF523 family)
MKILISACLLGQKVRYDGRDCLLFKSQSELDEFAKSRNIEFIPFCPEVAGGLAIPRDPSEILGNKVVTSKGLEVTEQFKSGAEFALALALKNKVSIAILKSRSPSCGVHEIYDGTFSKKLVSGMGFTAKLLQENGLRLFDETQIDEFFKVLDCK